MSSDTQALSRRGAARPAIQSGAILAAALTEQFGDRRISFGAARVHLLFLLLLLAAAGLVYAPVSAQTFDPKVNVSNTARTDSSWPQIAVVSPHVYVLWTDGRFGTQYLFSRSSNSGLSFSTPVQVIPDFADFRTLAATDPNVYVAYSGRPKHKEPYTLFFKRSVNKGASFENPIQVSSSGASAAGQAMAISGASVYLVWPQQFPTGVFFARSTDGGATFGDPVNLSTGSVEKIRDVRLAAEGPGVHVAWSQGNAANRDIFYRGSINGGESFGPVLNVSNNQTPYNGNPAIAVSGLHVYLAWREMGVRFAASIDGGKTFPTRGDLADGWTDTRGVAGGPAIAASGTAVQVIWVSDSIGTYQLFHRASANSGEIFGDRNNLSMSMQDSVNGINSLRPVITANGTHVYVAWHDPSSEVILVHSANDGATFGDAVNVSLSPGGSGGAALATTPTEIYVVWSDGLLEQSDVFFARAVP